MTPSPESNTIPVDFPVANLYKLFATMIAHPVLQQIRQGLETFQKIFKTFFYDA